MLPGRGGAPVDGVDDAYTDGAVNIVVDSAVAPTHYVQYGTVAGTTVENTGSIATGLSQFASGTATINGSISSTSYSFVGNNGASANVTVNGTWINTDMYMGGFTGANSVSSLTIGDGGSYTSAGQFSFSGGDNTNLTVNVNTGGTFTVGYLRFGQSANVGATNRTATFNVAGDDVMINTGNIFGTVQNENGVLVYHQFNPATIPDWANIVYDGSSILFTGLTTNSSASAPFIDYFTTVSRAYPKAYLLGQ